MRLWNPEPRLASRSADEYVADLDFDGLRRLGSVIVPEMTLPDQVHQIVAAVARKFIDLHRGTDDDRREATKRGVQTIRAKLVGQGVLDGARWVHKTQHSNLAAPSKDAIAFVPEGPIEHGRKAGMFMFDTINGTTREANPPGPGEFGEQFILVVEPKDWLEGHDDEPGHDDAQVQRRRERCGHVRHLPETSRRSGPRDSGVESAAQI